MGYKPDPALSALAAYRQRRRIHTDFAKLAVVSYWNTPDNWLKSTSGLAFWAGAEARARLHGFELEYFWLGKVDMNPRRASHVLSYRGVRGLILPPLPPDVKTMPRLDLDWSRFSVVTLERNDLLPDFLYVAPNYYNAMELAWQQLTTRSYRRIGLVLNEDNASRSQHQWEAVMLLEQQRHHGRSAPGTDTILVHSRTLTRGQFDEIISAWLTKTGADAVIVRSSHFGAWFQDQPPRLRRRFGVVCLNVDDDNFGRIRPTGIDQQRRVMGAAAVDLAHNLMLRNERGPTPHLQGMVVEGAWCEGDTLPRLRSP
jgi:LacI family transcriptional regulator